MKTNPNDPLTKVGAEGQQELFQSLVSSSAGHPKDDVINAAVNLLINAVRQHCSTRAVAEKTFDEIVGRAKSLLLDAHYDAATNKRRNIFPFHQVIEMPLMDLKKLKRYG